MSEAWPTAPLGEALRERRDTPDPIEIEMGDMAIVSKIAFDTGMISLRHESDTKTGMITVLPGDLLVSGINAYKGAIAIHTGGQPVAATIHYGAYEVRQDKAIARFLWWMLRSHAFRELLERHVPGGIKTELKAKRLLPIPIPLPPLAEQRRIVARLDALVTKIEEAKRLCGDVKRASIALNHRAMKAIRENLMAAGHRVAPLGSLTRVTSGGTPSRDNPAYWDGEIPWIKTGELLDGDITDSEERITPTAVENSSAKVFPPETVLVALYGQGQTRGRTGRLLISAATNQACAAVLPNPSVLDSQFVQFWLRSLYVDMREESHGGAQPNWSGGMIKDIEIALPPLDIQRDTVASVAAQLERIDALQGEQQQVETKLVALLPSLLNRAFAGAL